jgi:hypothetical protein
MGNGQSLNDIPESCFSIPMFGVNYCPHYPMYYVCVDRDILTVHHAKIYDLAKRAKIAYLAEKERGSSNLYDLPNVQLITHDKEAFHLEHYFSGLTVTYVALKCAYYAGFEEVHLWGVDHSADWAHYKKDYPPGDLDRRVWRMAEMEYHYRLAASVYNKAGRRIVNHSRPSKLDTIFQRVGKE